jgi:hypothetical protein
MLGFRGSRYSRSDHSGSAGGQQFGISHDDSRLASKHTNSLDQHGVRGELPCNCDN